MSDHSQFGNPYGSGSGAGGSSYGSGADGTPDWALPPVTVGIPTAGAPGSHAAPAPPASPPSFLRVVAATCAAAGAVVGVSLVLVWILFGAGRYMTNAPRLIDTGGSNSLGVSVNGTLFALALFFAAIAYGAAFAVVRRFDLRTAVAGALGALIGTASMLAAAAVWLFSLLFEAFLGTGMPLADKIEAFVRLLPHTVRYGLLPGVLALVIGVVAIYATGGRIGRSR